MEIAVVLLKLFYFLFLFAFAQIWGCTHVIVSKAAVERAKEKKFHKCKRLAVLFRFLFIFFKQL